MLAARYLGPNRLEPVDVAIGPIGEEEALIRIHACGFCGSDLGVVAGIHPRAKAPLTLGHEFSGTIEKIRTRTTNLKPGDLVTAYPLISCGHCYVCRTGDPHACRTLRLYGFDEDGAMAQYVRLPVSSLFRLPAGMSPLVGAVIEPLAVAVHGVSCAEIESEARVVAVIGAGPIGLLTALVARARGARRVVISDILPSRIQLAKQFGLEAVNAGAEIKDLVDSETSGDGADLVFECVGAPDSIREMTGLVRSRGKIVNLGVCKKPVKVDMQAVNFKEITVVGSRVYRRNDFEQAIELADSLGIRKIVTHTFPLTEVKAAFDRFQQGNEVCKVLILPNGIVE
jgi:2-desacetyl-2-hydroxyethyl bacteriochlorophyllide A dehydrogenase